MKRLALLLVPLLAAVPLRAALLRGEIAGAGPDVVTTLWTMWWFQQEWTGPAWGGHSVLFNFPFGGSGAILSPITATTWALLEPLVGIGPAATLTALSQLIGFVGAVMLLAGATGLSRIRQLAAGLAALGHRYLFFAVGETSVVGITALPLVFGLIGLVRLLSGELSWRWRLLDGLWCWRFVQSIFCLLFAGQGHVLWRRGRRLLQPGRRLPRKWVRNAGFESFWLV